MTIKFIIAMFLSLVAVNAQQGDAEKDTKYWIQQTQNIKDASIKEAVHLFITNILLDPAAFDSIIISDQYNSARKFLTDHSRMTTIKGSEFQNFGPAITGILEKMTTGQLASLQQSSTPPERAWYQQVIYILWNIKFYKTQALAKELLGIKPWDYAIYDARQTSPEESPQLSPDQPKAAPSSAPPSTDKDSLAASAPSYFPDQPRTDTIRRNPLLPPGSSMYASNPGYYPDLGAPPISVDNLLDTIEKNVNDRQQQYCDLFTGDQYGKIDFESFKQLLDSYNRLDGLFRDIRGNNFNKDLTDIKQSDIKSRSFIEAMKRMNQRLKKIDRYQETYNKIVFFSNIPISRGDAQQKLTILTESLNSIDLPENVHSKMKKDLQSINGQWTNISDIQKILDEMEAYFKNQHNYTQIDRKSVV